MGSVISSSEEIVDQTLLQKLAKDTPKQLIFLYIFFSLSLQILFCTYASVLPCTRTYTLA